MIPRQLARMLGIGLLTASAAAALAVALLPLPVNAKTKPLERFYGSVGGSLLTFGNSGPLKRDTDWRNVHASIGRYFALRNRVSMDVRLSESKTSTGNAALPYSIEQSYDSVALSLNAHRTLYQQGKLSLSLGVGVGVEEGSQKHSYRPDIGDVVPLESRNHTRLQHNIVSGLNWRVNDRFTLSAGYRVSWTDLEEGTRRQSMLNLTMRVNVGRTAGMGGRTPPKHLTGPQASGPG